MTGLFQAPEPLHVGSGLLLMAGFAKESYVIREIKGKITVGLEQWSMMIGLEVLHQGRPEAAVLTGAGLAGEHEPSHSGRGVCGRPNVRARLVPVLSGIVVPVLDDVFAAEPTGATRAIPTRRSRSLSVVAGSSVS